MDLLWDDNDIADQCGAVLVARYAAVAAATNAKKCKSKAAASAAKVSVCKSKAAGSAAKVSVQAKVAYSKKWRSSRIARQQHEKRGCYSQYVLLRRVPSAPAGSQKLKDLSSSQCRMRLSWPVTTMRK